MHRLNNVDLDGLHLGLCKGDFGSLKTLQNQIYKDIAFKITVNYNLYDGQMESENRYSDNQNGLLRSTTVHCDRNENASLFVGTVNHQIGKVEKFHQQKDNEVTLEMLDLSTFNESSNNNAIVQVTTSVNASSNDVIFALDSFGCLHMICPYTMLEIFCWNKEKVLEFVLLEDEGDTQLNLLMVTERISELNKCEVDTNLQIREYPSFHLNYELKVNAFCKPLSCSIGQENPVIIEGSFLNAPKLSEEELRSKLTALRIRGICEGNPEFRLSRLLRRNKFEEAETCARMNRLDFEKIYQSKSSWLLEKLSPWNVSNYDDSITEQNQKYLKELRNTLESMKNLDYMVRCCVTSALPSLRDTREILLLARNVIQKHLNRDDFDHNLLSIVSYTLQRLETFIYTYQITSKSEKAGQEVQPPPTPIDLIDKWSSFNRADMLLTVGQLLSQGEIDAGSLVWQRHQAEFSERLNSEQIRLLLDLIKPEEMKWDAYDQNLEKMFTWLSQFIPDCLRMVPECLPVIADWTTTTTKRLELRDRKNWPSNGLRLASFSLEAMHLCNENVGDSSKSDGLKVTRMPLTLHQQRMDNSSKLYTLTNLIESLQDLKILHGELRIRVRMDDFIQEDKIEVCTQLLDWCSSSDEVNLLVETFLLDFMMRFGLNKQEILVNYCEKLITDTGFCWYWELGSTAPWEEKVATIISYLTEFPSTQFQIILDALKYAPVPWSDTIKKLCEVGYHLPQNAMIREQEKLVDLKQILRKYNCRSFSVAGREADAVLKKVIKHGGSYEEVVTVGKLLHGLDEMSAKKFYVQNLLENDASHDQHKKAIQFIFKPTASSIGFDDVMEIANKLLIRAKLLFKYDFDRMFANCEVQKQSENFSTTPYLLFFKALIFEINKKFGPSDLDQKHMVEFESRINQFRSICELRLKFGIDLRETCAAEEIENVLNMKILEWVSNKSKCCNIDDVGMIYKELKELMLLLQPLAEEITNEKAVSMLIGTLTGEGKYDMAVEATKLLTGSNDNSIQDLCTNLTSETADTLSSLILRVNLEIANTEDSGEATKEQYLYKLPRIMAYLASQALNSCKDENLIDNIFVSSWQALMSNISQQFHNRNVFNKFQDGARADGSNILYDIWKFSPMFVDKGLPLPDHTALLVPAKFITALLPPKLRALPYIPSTIFCIASEIKPTLDYFEPKLDEKPVSDVNLLESTLAVCTLTPPNNRSQVLSPLCSKTISSRFLPSNGREEILRDLSKDILQHCQHYLNPMNQTVLTLESAIIAEYVLISLIASCSNPENDGLLANVSKFRDMIFQEAQKLLPKVLSDKRPDLLFALALLFIDDTKKKSLKILQRTYSTFNFDDTEKMRALARIGMRYCSKGKLPQQYPPFRKLLIRSVWANKLASLGGSYKTIFTADTREDKIKVLECLVIKNDAELKSLTVLDVCRFSEAFELDIGAVLTLFLKTTLTSSILEPRTVIDHTSNEAVISNFNAIVSEHISTAFSSIPDNEENDQKLYLITELFKKEISPYNYEVLQYLLQGWKCILQENINMKVIKRQHEVSSDFEENDETFMQNRDIEEELKMIYRLEKMLGFLLSYHREEEPEPEEIERWNESRPGVSFPAIARVRLPFNCLSEKTPKETFKFLMKEFKLSNLDQWLKLANEEKFVFRLSSNNICIQAAQNAVLKLVGSCDGSSSSIHGNTWLETLKDIEKCLQHITDLFQATSLTHWIINRLPDNKGEERLFCARMCRKFAEGWKQQAGEHDQTIQKGYHFAVTTQIRLEIEQILRQNFLHDDSTRQLLQEIQVLEPSKITQLIGKLYQHPSVIERTKSVVSLNGSYDSSRPVMRSINKTQTYPNINEAVKEIALVTNRAQDIFKINLDVIKYDLLDGWIKENVDQGSGKNNFDDTVTNFNFNLLASKSSSEHESVDSQDDDNSNYLKCVYLLQGFENRIGIDYLLQIAMDEGANVDSVDADLTSTRLNVANSNISTMHKLRSLKCLLSVVRQDELNKIGCGVFEEEHFIENKFHNLGFVSRLENLNLPAYDLESFEKCDKTALIEGILRTCSYSSEGMLYNQEFRLHAPGARN